MSSENRPSFASPFHFDEHIKQSTHEAIEEILRGGDSESQQKVRENQRRLEKKLPPATGAISDIRIGPSTSSSMEPGETPLLGV